MFPHKKVKEFFKDVEKEFQLSFSIKECLSVYKSMGGVGIHINAWKTYDPELGKRFCKLHFKDESQECDRSNPIHVLTINILTADVGELFISIVYNNRHVSLMAFSEEGDIIKDKLY